MALKKREFTPESGNVDTYLVGKLFHPQTIHRQTIHLAAAVCGKPRSRQARWLPLPSWWARHSSGGATCKDMTTAVRYNTSSSYVREGSTFVSRPNRWRWGPCFESVVLGAPFTPPETQQVWTSREIPQTKGTPEVVTNFKLCEITAHARMLRYRLYVLSRETAHLLKSNVARIILRGLIAILKTWHLHAFV